MIKIDDDKKWRQIAGNFAAVCCEAHCLIEHIPGFTRSHWMPPLSKCLRRIASVANMDNDFIVKHKTLIKTTFS